MAVRKQDVVNQVTPEVRAAVSAAEAIIDKRLENFSGSRIVVEVAAFGLTGDSEFIARVIKEIIASYNKSGWTVKLEFDQRDGDWLEFS